MLGEIFRSGSRCVSNGCPDIDPVTGKYKGTNTLRAQVNGEETTVTVNRGALVDAAKEVRREARNGIILKNQFRGVQAVKKGEEVMVIADVSGSTVLREARLARIAQLGDHVPGVPRIRRRRFATAPPITTVKV